MSGTADTEHTALDDLWALRDLRARLEPGHRLVLILPREGQCEVFFTGAGKRGPYEGRGATIKEACGVVETQLRARVGVNCHAELDV